MYSSAPVPPPANIGLCWTDEEICECMERMAQGFPIPGNVIDDNPYQYRPSNLPDMWFFMRSEQENVSEYGSWNARGEACEIFRNSAITGWRTTLEFYEGQAPHRQRTNWVMQEYRINHKGLHSNGNLKVSGVLCRVFHSSPNPEMLHKMRGLENSGRNHFHPSSSGLVIQEPGSATGRGSMIESQARDRDDNMGLLAAHGGHRDIPILDSLDMDSISRGDFLELADLDDGESRSSSSDNTSCVTISSEECFDSLALLQDLEDSINRQEQEKDANFKFSVAASVRPTEVVLPPANSGSLISSNGRQPPAGDAGKKVLEKKDPKNAIKSQKTENGNEGTSNSRNVATSSRHKTVPEEEKEDRVKRMKKLRKKYLCFMPF